MPSLSLSVRWLIFRFVRNLWIHSYRFPNHSFIPNILWLTYCCCCCYGFRSPTLAVIKISFLVAAHLSARINNPNTDSNRHKDRHTNRHKKRDTQAPTHIPRKTQRYTHTNTQTSSKLQPPLPGSRDCDVMRLTTIRSPRWPLITPWLIATPRNFLPSQNFQWRWYGASCWCCER